MKVYDIYFRSDELPVVVKNGFSWPAFFFLWIWALLQKLYLHALGIMIVLVMLPFVGAILALFAGNQFRVSYLNLFLSLVFAFMVGSLANRWRKRRLTKEGYKFIDSVEAPNSESAFLKAEEMLAIGEDIKVDNISEREAELFKKGSEWQCHNCGNKIEGQFTSCWSCGTDRFEKA